MKTASYPLKRYSKQIWHCQIVHKKEKLSIPDNYCHTLRPENPGSWIGTLFAIE